MSNTQAPATPPFLSYTSVNTFKVSVDADRPENEITVTVNRGDSIKFNGKTAYINDTEYNMPKLAVAVRLKWIHLDDGQELPEPVKIDTSKVVQPATPQQRAVNIGGAVEFAENDVVVASAIRDRKVVASDSSQDAQTVNVTFKASTKTKIDATARGKSAIQDVSEIRSSTVQQEGVSFTTHNVVGDDKTTRTGGNREVHQHIAQVSSPFSDEAPIVGRIGKKAQENQRIETELDDTLDPKTKEGRYLVAKTIIPDLPEWDFTLHWTKKMDILRKERASNQLLVRAVFASESDALRKRIAEEFPDIF